MAVKSNAYWNGRAERRMDEYLRGSEETTALLSRVYQRTLKGIESDIENIFENYRKRHQLTPEQAKEYLASPISRSEYERLLSLVDGITDPVEKQDMLARINAPAYQYRMSREMALQVDIEARMAQLADVEIAADTGLFHGIIEDAYGHTLFDIQKGTGIGFRVNAMSPGLVREILRNPWSGEVFSERVWKNTSVLAEQLNEVLTDAMQRGRSWRQTADDLAGRMSVGYHEAERLVRTESVYMANAAEIQGYKAAGIEKYRFLATLDSRTSAACQGMDGKEFFVTEAEPGVNLPPLHPNCRSTTVAVFDDMNMANFERMARDPVTGENYKVPANMSYEDWRKKYLTGNTEAEAAMAKLNNDNGQYERYKQRLGAKTTGDFASFQKLKDNDGVDWERMKWDYRFEGKYGITRAEDLLPNLHGAYDIDRKLTTYSLNPEHPRGKHKAVVFKRALGYTLNNAAALEAQITRGLSSYRAVSWGDKGYGEQFRVKMMISGPNGTQAVDTGWIFDPGSSRPRMVNAIVDKKSRRP